MWATIREPEPDFDWTAAKQQAGTLVSLSKQQLFNNSSDVYCSDVAVLPDF